jgi:hypothetical protein
MLSILAPLYAGFFMELTPQIPRKYRANTAFFLNLNLPHEKNKRFYRKMTTF